MSRVSEDWADSLAEEARTNLRRLRAERGAEAGVNSLPDERDNLPKNEREDRAWRELRVQIVGAEAKELPYVIMTTAEREKLRAAMLLFGIWLKSCNYEVCSNCDLAELFGEWLVVKEHEY